MIPLANNEPQINYYSAGDGWVGYTIWWRGKIMAGGELRNRAAAVKDAQATVRRLKAEQESPA
jgi:hypothetical protein